MTLDDLKKALENMKEAQKAGAAEDLRRGYRTVRSVCAAL